VTGLALETPEISAKALSLFKEAIPSMNRVAVLWNQANPAFPPVWQAVDDTARAIGLELLSKPVREPQDFAPMFAETALQRSDGLLVLIDAFVGQFVRQIVEFSIRERVPAASTFREFVGAGGLLSYGPDLGAAQWKAASHIDRVFKGEKAADLPFEQPTKFELIINSKTAKTLARRCRPRSSPAPTR
jgi:putative ABC transport system substrate-binding protein